LYFGSLISTAPLGFHHKDLNKDIKITRLSLYPCNLQAFFVFFVVKKKFGKQKGHFHALSASHFG
jgi:hypothetical protein